MARKLKEDPIRNFYGQIIGYIETFDNGDKTIRNFYKQILGYYQASDNTTRNFYKQIIAKGDSSALLLTDEYQKSMRGKK